MFRGRIYCVICLPNEKWYFGQTIRSVNERFAQHILSAQRGSDHKFHRAIRKYGEENFLVEEVMWVEADNKKKLRKKLDFLEIHFIQKFDTYRNGYNSTYGGEGALGTIRSKETRKRLSLIHKGKKLSEEHRRKLSLALKGNRNSLGRKPSEETRKKLSISASFRRHTSETKKKISLSRIGEKNPFYGKKMSKESKKKMISSKGIPEIIQYSLEGDFIKEFPNMEVIKEEINISKKCLRKHIHNGLPYKGFIWKYKYGN